MNIDALDPADLEVLRRRLRRVEGQIRALQQGLDRGGDCRDLLRQFTAASNALRSAGVTLAITAFEHCTHEGGDIDVDAVRKALLALS